MKLTIVLSLFCTIAFSSSSYSQGNSLSLNVENTRIKDVFRNIEKQSSYRFFYNDELSDVNRIVKLSVSKSSINDVLNQLFADSDISYTLLENNLIVVAPKRTVQQQSVSGVVTDVSTGEPLPGVNVLVEGTTVGVITDIDGKYSLNALPSNAVLIFSFVGYNSERVEVNNKININVSLVPDITKLDEVVVIGYGQAKKKDLSVAISSVNLEKMKSRPVGAIGMIQGQMPGVTVTNNGGDPLSSASIVIRGKGSRNGDQILYVVDGVPGAPFNTEDVESITVLKDAASAAIYGAHVGSGGVIVVTTKKAQAGKIQVNANVYRGWQQAWKIPQALTAEEYNKVMIDAANDGNGNIPKVTDAALYPYGQTTRTDWTKEIFRIGKTEHYAVSLTGGSENIKALGSVEYDKREGTLLNTFYNNLGTKLNLDFKINNKLSFSQLGQYSLSNGQGDVNTSSHTGVIAAAMFMPSSAPVYESDGTYCGTVPKQYSSLGVAGDYGEVQNPVATLRRLDQYRPDQTIFSSSALTFKPIPDLTIKSTFSIKNRQTRYEDFSPKIPEIGKSLLENSRSINSGWGKKWLWENIVTYSKTIGERHNITAMAGFTSGYENWRYMGLQVFNFPDEDSYSRILVNGTDYSKNKPVETFWEETQISSFGRLSYSYANKYFLTSSIRYDATSKLYKSKRDGIFPAVSGAWKISEESFFKNNINAISLLKLRASWGQIGNVASVPRYSSNVTLSSDGYFTYLGNNVQNPIMGIGLTTFSNLNLTWETSVQTDLGLDINLFSDKLNFVFDYFEKTTKDMIDLLPVPSVAGVQVQPYGNIGDVQNKGFELGINHNGAFGKFKYDVGFNYSYLENKVTSLGQQDYMAHTDYQIRSLVPLRSAVGQPWYSYYLIQTDGIFQNQTEIDNYALNGVKIQPNAKPGDLKFKDVSGPGGTPDGVINEKDKVYQGSYAPKNTFGFNASFSYLGFDFGFQLQGINGIKIFNAFKALTQEGTQGWNLSDNVLDSWTYNKSSDIPRVTNNDQNKNYTTESDFFLEDGSYLRLKNLTLGYTLPQSLLSKAGCKETNIRFYLSGENILTFTKYGGMDPEVGNNGLDGGRYPLARIFSAGLNVSF